MTFFHAGKKLPAWPKVSPIDGTYRFIYAKNTQNIIIAGSKMLELLTFL